MVSLKVLLVVGTVTSDNYETKTLRNHSFMNAIILPTLLDGLCEEYLPNEIFCETGCKNQPHCTGEDREDQSGQSTFYCKGEPDVRWPSH